VRSAREVPVANAWGEADGFAVEDDLPVGRGEGGKDFLPTAAATTMSDRSVLQRNVEQPRLQVIGDVLYEAVL